MKLNRTGSNWNRLERNKINENWNIIEGSYNDVVGQITDEVVGNLIDSAKLDWKEPVDSFGDLPSRADEGDTRMVRSGDKAGKVYRFDGSNWVEIQEINPTPINEVDNRLTQQLVETDQQRFFESMINRKGKSRGMISIVDDDGDKGFYTKLRPLALEYGIVFTSALVTGVARGFPGDERTQSGKYMDYDDIMTMHNEGTAEFIGHSHTHPNLRELSLSELREEFTNSQEFLRRYGLNHRGMVFPYNRVNQQVMDTVREYF